MIKLFQDGSGAISSKELLYVMRAMGQNPTEDELNNLVMQVDLDGNGTIEFPEFLEMMKRCVVSDQESELRWTSDLDCKTWRQVIQAKTDCCHLKNKYFWIIYQQQWI